MNAASAQASPDAKLIALEFLLVFAALLFPLQAILDVAKFTVFTTRDLDRAQLLAAGRLIFFGPEASGGGHLPGPFYYFLLAAPLKLGLGWKAIWQLQFAMTAAGVSLIWLFVRLRLGAFPAYYAVFCAAFLDPKVLFFGYNASFLPLFAAAALVSLCLAYDEDSGRRGAAWAVFCLACGLGLQFHMTFSLLLLAGLAAQLAARRLGLAPLALKPFAAGLTLFLATLLPYGIWAVCAHYSVQLGQPALPFTGASAVKLWGILNYSIEARAGLPARILTNRTISLLPFEALLPLLLLYAGARRGNGAAAPAQAPAGTERFAAACIKVLSIAAALTAFTYAMSLALSPSRYAVVPRMSLHLLVCAVLARYQARIRPGRFYPAAVALLFVFVLAWRLALSPSAGLDFGLPHAALAATAGLALAFLAARSAGRALFPLALVLPLFLSLAIRAGVAGHAGDDVPGFGDFEAMSREIFSRTGWSYEEARLRIFYVNARAEVTPSYVYRAVAAGGRRSPLPGTGLGRVDGYFAALFQVKKRDAGAAADPAARLLALDLPDMLKEGITSGGIRLGAPAGCGRLTLIPYEVTDTQKFPPYFHNGSEGYSDTGPVPPPAPAPGERVFRFKFNDCPGHGEWCDIMADVRMRPLGAGRWLTRVTFSGEPLAQVCDGVNLRWNQILNTPYFEATCGGRKNRVALAGTLGMHRDKYRDMNESLLAPYERVFGVDCRGPLEKVAVGYGSAAAYSLTRLIDGLPGAEMSAKGDGDAAARP
jgi:hypothetical protein